MNKQPDPRETLLHDLLQTFIDEYREISEVWRDLDKKANNTATISGIFIAGILAFIRGITIEVDMLEEQILLTVTIVLLAASIVFSLLCIFVRKASSAPSGNGLASMIRTLLKPNTSIKQDELMCYYNDSSKMWEKANKDIKDKNHKKANSLFYAQVLLLLAIASAAIFTFLKIWKV